VKQDIKAVNQVLQIDSNKLWVNKTNINKRPFTRPNISPLYRPNDNRPRWNDTYNQPLVWNGPPSNPNTHYYGPSERGKHVVCFRCGELGHYLNNCPNARKQVGYTPLCGRCWKKGHLREDCTAPPRNLPPLERDYLRNKQVQFEEPENSRPSNHVSHIITEEKLDPQNVFVAIRATLAKQNLPKFTPSQNLSNLPTSESNDNEIQSIPPLLQHVPLNQGATGLNNIQEKEVIPPVEIIVESNPLNK